MTGHGPRSARSPAAPPPAGAASPVPDGDRARAPDAVIFLEGSGWGPGRARPPPAGAQRSSDDLRRCHAVRERWQYCGVRHGRAATRGRGAGHVPVMLGRVLELLGPAAGGLTGRRRPSTSTPRSAWAATPRRCSRAVPELRLIGLDRDPAALERSERTARPVRRPGHAGARRLRRDPSVLRRLGVAAVDAVLFDLGVSSPQLDETDRGFAYSHDAPLDMRMDPTQRLTAAEVVNSYPAAELARILREYGEERFAQRIASAIVRERERAPFTSTRRLAELVRDLHPGRDAPHRRQPGQAHLPGAAHRGERRTRRPAPGAARRARGARRSAAGSPSCPTTPSRTASPSRSSPPRRPTRRRRTCPSRCPGTSRGSGS